MEEIRNLRLELADKSKRDALEFQKECASQAWIAFQRYGWNDHAVAKLERCRKAGLLGALVWQAPPPELSFATNHYERLWAAAQDLEVPISLHILTGQPFLWPRPMSPSGRRQAFETMRNAVNNKLNTSKNRFRPCENHRRLAQMERCSQFVGASVAAVTTCARKAAAFGCGQTIGLCADCRYRAASIPGMPTSFTARVRL